MNVAKMLNLPEWNIVTKILLPSVLPYMLTGGVGIGFWVTDNWNNLNVPPIIIAIVVIGVVGLMLAQGLVALARTFTYEEVRS